MDQFFGRSCSWCNPPCDQFNEVIQATRRDAPVVVFSVRIGVEVGKTLVVPFEPFPNPVRFDACRTVDESPLSAIHFSDPDMTDTGNECWGDDCDQSAPFVGRAESIVINLNGLIGRKLIEIGWFHDGSNLWN